MVRLPRLKRPVVLGVVLGLAALTGAGGFIARRAAEAAEPVAGVRLSALDIRVLVRAASACPTLTPARLAGQVTVASRFGSRPVGEMRDGGRIGIAALTPDQWRDNMPSPGADPADHEAGITALAHVICRQVAQARAVLTDEDPWRIALAAYRVGMDQVVAAGGIPNGSEDYVKRVQRYATWYAAQSAIGGAPSPQTATPPATIVPVPDRYVPAVKAAGMLCPDVPPSRIAAQIMASSGFDPDKLGPAAEHGLAQFRPQIWSANVPAVTNASPWEPLEAITALGHTMCALVRQAGGQYGPALATFTRGVGAAATPLLDVVTKAETEYAKDTRLQLPKAPATSTPTSPPKPRRGHPPVSPAGGGSGTSYGPFFVFDLRTAECVDLPGRSAGTVDGRVNQAYCSRSSADNQEWTFESRASDTNGLPLYWFRNVADGYCLDSPAAGPAGSVAEAAETNCTDQAGQYFRLEPTVVKAGVQYYFVRNALAGLCLDVPGAGVADPDVRLRFQPCKRGDDHEWALIRKADL